MRREDLLGIQSFDFASKKKTPKWTKGAKRGIGPERGREKVAGGRGGPKTT